MYEATRSEILKRLRAQVAAGKPIIGGGAGTGLSAKCAEAGGIDLIIIYNSGRFRMGGRGSLSGMMPYGDANQIVMDMAREVIPIVKRTPVLAGVCGTDPFREMKLFLRDLKALGFNGIQNFPTVGLIDGTFRIGLEETGMGYGLEVDAVKLAADMDLLTCPYVFSVEDAVAMTKAGADVLIPHMGLTTKGMIGATTALTLKESLEGFKKMSRTRRRPFAPISWFSAMEDPSHGDAQYILENTDGVVGFFRGLQRGAAPHGTGDHRPGTSVQATSLQRLITWL
ncbi:MAG: phosphoenolpyruvate hydrolase family protein [Planctomycetota bacterium]